MTAFRRDADGTLSPPRREATRVLIVHSAYRSSEPSGENAAVRAHVDALRRSGFDVFLALVRTDDRRSFTHRIEAATTVATGIGRSPLGAIEAFLPDIVHVHNLFPNFGRRWVKKVRAPIVHTLHNFRPMCAAGTLFRSGSVCTLCPAGNRVAGLRYGCYRGSRAQTLPLTLSGLRGARHDPVLRAASALVVLSERSRRVYESAGIPSEKLRVIPNFATPATTSALPANDARAGWLYVGRIASEKGIDLLVERWPPGFRLRVVGDGPLMQATRNLATGKDVEFLGKQNPPEVSSLMRESVGLVFPSRWYEGFPMVYAEAMSSGLPVLAFDPSSVADLVRRDGTGLTASWSDDLSRMLGNASQLFGSLIDVCRARFEEEYTETAFVRRIRRLYSDVICDAQAVSHRASPRPTTRGD